ncbi:VIT family-domain-containing protein [Podospora didyma]|uniref:VIT family-domain-containing protein n=1 Tax=Podospora didyma TaxID=330526 RepID=A0AAE0TVJ6_9PEZI|nr:VIT family-domain-containing protein [Podospora didyma]
MLLPSLRRFLAEFTLGFADGLTVPFALMAGLSSSGQTSTVIYAGMAEICAGSISMGVGGYLAARGDNVGANQTPLQEPLGSDGDDTRHGSEEESRPLQDTDEDLKNERPGSHNVSQGNADFEKVKTLIVEYLDPLCLPTHLIDAAWSHTSQHADVEGRLPLALSRQTESQADEEHGTSSAIMAGLSVPLS